MERTRKTALVLPNKVDDIKTIEYVWEDAFKTLSHMQMQEVICKYRKNNQERPYIYKVPLLSIVLEC